MDEKSDATVRPRGPSPGVHPYRSCAGRDTTTLIAPEVGPQVIDDVRAALRHGRPWSGESPVRRKDGTRFTALVTDAGIYREGDLIAVIGVSTNPWTALRPLLERSTDAALENSIRRSRNSESSLTFQDRSWRRSVDGARSTAQRQRT